MSIIKIGSSVDYLANKYVNYFVIVPPKGSNIGRADLEQMIKDAKDKCADYCHQQNFTIGRPTARGVCSGLVDAKFKELYDAEVAATYAQDEKVKQLALQGNKQIYGIAAVVLLVLVGIALILRG